MLIALSSLKLTPRPKEYSKQDSPKFLTQTALSSLLEKPAVPKAIELPLGPNLIILSFLYFV